MITRKKKDKQIWKNSENKKFWKKKNYSEKKIKNNKADSIRKVWNIAHNIIFQGFYLICCYSNKYL